MPSDYELDTKVLDAIIKHHKDNVADAIAKVAFTIEGKAKIKAPVDTGALRASIYTSLINGGHGESSMEEARGLRPKVATDPLPKPRDPHTAYVGPSVEYGANVEFGSNKMAGRPYLQPAVRETEEAFKKIIGKAVVETK